MSTSRPSVLVERRPGPPFRAILEIEAWETVKIRVVVSPLETLFASLYEIVAGRHRGVPSAWVQTVLHRARDLDLTPFELYAIGGIRMPDLFAPASGATPTFEEELAGAIAPEAITKELSYEYGSAIPPAFAEWVRDPAAAQARYLRAVRDWWDAVLKPSWPAISSALHAELSRVGRLLATRSIEEALREVHPRLLVRSDGLHVEAGPVYERHVLRDRTVVLQPVAAGADALMVQFDHPHAAFIGYSPPGIQGMLAQEAPANSADLVALLGEARARIVAHLAAPASTTELAATLGYAVSTVSTHLRALALMGLVRATRHAKFVFYERTERAEGLLELYRSH